MSEPIHPGAGAPPPPPPPAWPRASVIVSAIAVLIIGIALGFVVDRAMLRHRGFAPRARMVGFREPFARGGGDAWRRMHDRLARDLDLTPAQSARIDSIMAKRVADLRQIQQEMRPRMRAVLQQTRAEMDSVLTPAQREKMRSLHPMRGPLGGMADSGRVPGAGRGPP